MYINFRPKRLPNWWKNFLSENQGVKIDGIITNTNFPPFPLLSQDYLRQKTLPPMYSYVHAPQIKSHLMNAIKYDFDTTVECGVHITNIRYKMRRAIFSRTYNYGQRAIREAASHTKFLVNSKWGKQVMVDSCVVDPKNVITIYPPCDSNPSEIGNTIENNPKTTDVISIGAIVPYKRHHAIIDICNRTKSVRTVDICGFSYNDPVGLRYKHILDEKFTSVARSKNKRVRILTNLDDVGIYDATCRAKCVMSGHLREDFGIALVEAVAKGCIPVVPDAFGFKETVPYPELRYTDEIVEAPRIVDDVLGGVYDDLIPKLKKHVAQFSYDEFNRNISTHVVKNNK